MPTKRNSDVNAIKAQTVVSTIPGLRMSVLVVVCSNEGLNSGAHVYAATKRPYIFPPGAGIVWDPSRPLDTSERDMSECHPRLLHSMVADICIWATCIS